MKDVIRTNRLRLGLSQQELGECVGVNKSAVQKWENGTVENVKRSTIKTLSNLFGICPAELLGWGDEYNEKQTQKDNAIPNLEQAAKDLSLNERKQVFQYIDFLKSQRMNNNID